MLYSWRIACFPSTSCFAFCPRFLSNSVFVPVVGLLFLNGWKTTCCAWIPVMKADINLLGNKILLRGMQVLFLSLLQPRESGYFSLLNLFPLICTRCLILVSRPKTVSIIASPSPDSPTRFLTYIFLCAFLSSLPALASIITASLPLNSSPLHADAPGVFSGPIRNASICSSPNTVCTSLCKYW